MQNIISSVILGIIAIVLFIFSYRHFAEKGFLLNNSYIFASRKEREAMNKKPYYRQSGVELLLLGISLLILAADEIIQTGWLFYCVIAGCVLVLVYDIVSSVMIEKRKG